MEYIWKEFTEADILLMKERIVEIQGAYVPVMPWDAPEADLLYITQKYNDLYPVPMIQGEDILFAMNYEPQLVGEDVIVEETPVEVAPEEGV